MNDPIDPTLTVCATVGEDGFRKLVAAFYRQIPSDELLGPMYQAHDLQEAEKRLAGFLIYRFGGPDTYLHERGQPKLRMRHAPFTINQAARDRWVKLMDAALQEMAWPSDVVAIVQPFLHDSATFLINRG